MTDKFRYMVNSPPAGSTSSSGLRASYQPGLGAPLSSTHFSVDPNNSSNTNHPPNSASNNMMSPRNNMNLKPPLSSPPPSQPASNNYSMNIKQLQNKMDSVFSQLNSNKTTFCGPSSSSSTPSLGMDFSDLRNSISTTQIKKFDTSNTNSKDFLRRTAYTPNNPKTFNLDQTSYTNNTSTSSAFQDNPSSHAGGAICSPIGTGFIKKQQEVPPSNTFKQHQGGAANGFLMPSYPPTHSHMPNLSHSHSQNLPAVKPSPIVCGFYIGKSLGVGKFGEVYQAKHIASGFLCALKKIVKAKVLEFNMVNQLIQEMKLQAFMTHPNIVQFYGVFSDEQNIYIALEYMEGGTLFDYATNFEVLSEPDAAGFLREVSEAVKYMHNKDIAHRDIKPENIVLSYGLAKLCDFGWAARINGTRKTYCGTLDYVPPEMLQRKEYDQTVDLWCLGILAYELMTGKVPFEGKERKTLVQKIVNVDKDKIVFPESMSVNARDFIQNLIKKNPNERMKAYKIVQHPFLHSSDEKR